MYTEQDVETLNRALHGFPLCDLGPACRARVDALRVHEGLSTVKSMLYDEDARVKTDQATFLILAYSCCINQTTWFLKHEALRLMARVRDLTVPEKVMLLRILQVEVRVDAAHTPMYCINFEDATRLVSARSVTLRLKLDTELSVQALQSDAGIVSTLNGAFLMALGLYGAPGVTATFKGFVPVMT